ncbi:glucose-1-phosphate thymidylyltransferase [Prochlorococcus marinus str. MIT 9515]|uniref:Glucose-1-phosphate thymidylyltransferase n=1 Tax=Prochlorococcus marinus (strain MIT 9515) TaxID=167542 RepID=A2BXV6_PROM5|nr:glucose-1-phosphate thymidylyltransferase RfbA [Prochlorococcus marinus]ABM72617.1 glucose-1-phosphate thymidylyltransferase [Prochlorococcus marinus str. MIT 9515]
MINLEMKKRKGIILAGGLGTRLSPISLAISKQLMPVYDKPMIYYPLTTLMLADINDILLISSPDHLNSFKRLLGDGKSLGINIEYASQEKPQGIAQALIIGEKFLNGSPSVLILGDNLFHGNELLPKLESANLKKDGATIFAYPVSDPERYGVVYFNKSGKACSIEEKPSNPKSRFAITGIYFYDDTVISKAKKIKPSLRGELEISSINKLFLQESNLNVEIMGRGMAWLDTGTFDSLNEASNYIRALEKRQGLKIGSPEEVAWRKGWIKDSQLKELGNALKSSSYGKYLLELLKN